MMQIANSPRGGQKLLKSIIKVTLLFILFLLLFPWSITAAQDNTENKIEDIESHLPSLQGKKKIEALHKLSTTPGRIPIEKRIAYGIQALILSRELEDGELHSKSLRSLGEIYEEIGDQNRTLEYYQKSLIIAETNNDQNSIAICLNKIGLIYKHLGQYKKALEILLRAEETYKDTGNKKRLAAVLNNIGLVYKSLNNYNRSMEYNLKSLKIKEELGDKKGISKTLNNIGLVYKNMNNFSRALEYNLKSLKIKEELGDKKGISKTLNNIGLLYRRQGKKHKALNSLLESLKIKEEVGDKKGISISLNNIGLLYKDLFNYDKALEYFIRSLKMKEPLDEKKAIASSLNNIGVIYMELEDNHQALEYYQRALQINKELNNIKGIATSYNNIGIIYNRSNNHIEALEFHSKAKKLHNRLNNKEGIANSLNNMGLVYRSLKDYDRALTYHLEALKINEEIQEKEGISSSLNNIGMTYIRLNQYEQAVRHFQRSLEIKREIEDKSGTAHILIRLGEIYVNTKNLKKALPYIQKSLKLAEEIEEKNTIKECYKTLSDLYSEKKDYKRALEYFKRFRTIEDSIITRDSSNKIASLRAKLEAEREKQEQEIEILKKVNAIKDLKLNRQKVMRRTYTIAFFVFFVLILVILYMYRLKSKSGKQLTQALEETVHEIDARKKVELEKKQLQEQLFQSQKLESLGRLAGGIAHDFNNLLTGIMGYAEILKMKLTKNQQLESRAADTIYKNSIAAQELTKRLLGFARKGKYNPVSLSLNDTIKDTISVLEKIFGKNIRLKFDLAPQIKWIDADENQITQVLTNLIINAKDAMPEGGEITFNTRNVDISEENSSIYPEIIKPGPYVKLSISDTGIGMTKEILNQIFEPFFTTKEKDKGTGLGLATVYGIIKNHEGYVFCQSQPNKGTTFDIFLPPGEKGLIKKEKKNKNITGSGTILVVDDEESILKVSKDFLVRLGYKVLSTKNCNEAVETYTNNTHQIDLVLLDIIMPGKDGLETLQELKKINPHVKVLFFSGFSKNKKINEVLEEGVVEFIEKPFNMNLLSAIVSKMLEPMK